MLQGQPTRPVCLSIYDNIWLLNKKFKVIKNPLIKKGSSLVTREWLDPQLKRPMICFNISTVINNEIYKLCRFKIIYY